MDNKIRQEIDRVVRSLLCGIFSLIPFSWRSVSKDKRPENILVIFFSEMGNIVLAKSI